MMKTLLVSLFSLFGLVFGVSHAQETGHVHKPHPHKHEQYAKEKSPVPMTEQSIEKGRELFGKHCSGCHGEKGRGVGTLDLTDSIVIHGDTDGEIFHVITDGIEGTAMRPFKKELTKDMRWHLVNYMKSLKGPKKN